MGKDTSKWRKKRFCMCNLTEQKMQERWLRRKLEGKRSCMGQRGRVVNRAVRSGIVSSWWKPCWAESGCPAGWRRGFGLSRAESDRSMSSTATWGIQVSVQLTGYNSSFLTSLISGVEDGGFLSPCSTVFTATTWVRVNDMCFDWCGYTDDLWMEASQYLSSVFLFWYWCCFVLHRGVSAETLFYCLPTMIKTHSSKMPV